MVSTKSTESGGSAHVVNSVVPSNMKETSTPSSEASRRDTDLEKKSKAATELPPRSQREQAAKDARGLNRSSSVRAMSSLRKIFHRSQSHHEPAGRSRTPVKLGGGGMGMLHGALDSEHKNRSRSSSLLHRKNQHANAQQVPNHLIQSPSNPALNSALSHNVNPFIAHRNPGFDSPFSALGKGTDIAAPRKSNTHGSNPISRKTSSNESNMVYNPYGTLSKNNTSSSQHGLSFYLQDGKEELPLLPTPLKDPNDFLPEGYRQYSVQLADNFCYPERNTADDLHLGSGGSSEVRTVRSLFHKKDLYALKKFKLLRNEEPEHFYKRCSKEFILAKRLSKNPHIANTFYLVKVSTTTFMTRGWAFVMEYCSGGDLYSLISKPTWKKRPLREKFDYWRQVVEGIKFVHSQGVVHRDLKPENVLIDREGTAKITDFGISDWGHEDPDDLSSPVKLFENYVGSPPYSPPEVMAFNDDNATKQDKKPYDAHKMDCWALGMLLFVLVYQCSPFLDAYKTDSKFRSYVLSYNNYVDHINPQFRKPGNQRAGPGSEFQFGREFQSGGASRVAWRLADPDSKTRYTMQDLLEDPWWVSISAGVHEDLHVVPKAPELRHSSYESAGGFSPTTSMSAKGSEEDLAHTSNPFLTKTKNKSKSMLSIAETPGHPLVQSQSESLPTLSEEKASEDGVAVLPQEDGKTTALPQEHANAMALPQEHGKTTALPQEHGKTTDLPQEHANITALPQEHANITALPQEHGKTTALPQEHANLTALPQEHGKTTALPQEHANLTALPQEHGKTTALPQVPDETHEKPNGGLHGDKAAEVDKEVHENEDNSAKNDIWIDAREKEEDF
ncbi:LAQU0S03e01068g1_1 [Lachancea quebecensis]|uniref:non-specific serine/threonine protein kinase n=1 Tax=Lachancea quebecensis TaxID=1654605 RepID=A0A0P1KNI1_9SACH|nr:LAQU0S03e01068g1_1 [Lachancea quebecensis]